ncbi:MAG: hypothetical protein ACTSRH_04125 [Promethearchaeota archaeon]
MEEELRILKPACPKCGASKAINVPESLFQRGSFGFVKIQVPKGAICEEHQFIVITDNTGLILGYEEIDDTVVRIEEELELEEERGLTLQYLIKRLGFNCIAGLLHSKIFNYPAFIITSQELEFSLDELNEFFDNLFPREFKDSNNKIELIEYDDEIFPNPGYFYSLVKNQRKNAFLMNPRRHVIQIPWRTTIRYETSIINFALEKNDPEESYKILSDLILRFLEDVKFTRDTLTPLKKISEKDLIKILDNNLTLSTINRYRMILIKEFIRRRISPDLIKKIKKK